jgi:hypothetical protein
MTPHTEPPDEVFLECLSCILIQGERLEQALSRYPQWAAELKPRLEAALWLTQQRPSVEPRAAFLPAGKRRLVSQLKQEPRRWSWLSWLAPWQRRPVAPAVRFALAFCMALALFANGAVVNAAARVAYPGEVFYPLKKVEERIQLTVSPGGLTEVELHLMFALRRAAEIDSLILEGRYEHLPATIKDFEHQVSQAITLLARMDPQEALQAEGMVRHLENMLTMQAATLKVLVQLAPLENQNSLVRTIQASENGMMAFHVLRMETTPQPFQK